MYIIKIDHLYVAGNNSTYFLHPCKSGARQFESQSKAYAFAKNFYEGEVIKVIYAN